MKSINDRNIQKLLTVFAKNLHHICLRGSNFSSLAVSFSCIVNKIIWWYKSRRSQKVFTLNAKNFANFTGKIHVLESLFEKASGPHACKFITKRLQHSYFPVKLARFSFFTEHFRCLVFKASNTNTLLKDFSAIPLTHNWSLITCNSHNDKLYLKMHSLTKKLFR